MMEVSMFESSWPMGQAGSPYGLPGNSGEKIVDGGLDDIYGKSGGLTDADFLFGGDLPDLGDLEDPEISTWVEKYVDLDDITSIDCFDNIQALKQDVRLPCSEEKDKDILQIEDTLNQLIELKSLAADNNNNLSADEDDDYLIGSPASVHSVFSPCPSPTEQYSNLTVQTSNNPYSPISAPSPCTEYSLYVNPVTCEPVAHIRSFSISSVETSPPLSPAMSSVFSPPYYESNQPEAMQCDPVEEIVSELASDSSYSSDANSTPPSSPELPKKRRRAPAGRAAANRKTTPPVRRQSSKTKNKRERKRDQNKSAATRYRQKKKAEADDLFDMEQEVILRNKELKAKVETLSTEIGYLKRFLKEIMNAKKQAK